MKHPPWKVLLTVPSLLVVAVTFGWFALQGGGEASVAIAAGAAGALGGYLGKLNGSP